jgi:hypothetical protein
MTTSGAALSSGASAETTSNGSRGIQAVNRLQRPREWSLTRRTATRAAWFGL